MGATTVVEVGGATSDTVGAGGAMSVATAPASSVSMDSGSPTAFLVAAFFLGLARTFSMSTFSVVSTAEWLDPPNHSRIVASRPILTLDMWLFMGMPSAWHFSRMALDLTPSSFAISKIRFAFANCLRLCLALVRDRLRRRCADPGFVVPVL